MRILELSSKPPFPEVDGGTLATSALMKGLVDLGHKVHCISLCTEKHPEPDPVVYGGERLKFHFRGIPANTYPSAIKAGLAVITGENYHISRFDQPKMHEAIKTTLANNRFDAVILEGLFVGPYLDTIRNSAPKIPIIYRAHNIEFKLWEKRIQEETNKLAQYGTKTLTKRLKSFELQVIKDSDFAVGISKSDSLFLNQQTGQNLPLIPFGINANDYPVKDSFSGKQIGYLGALDWVPNIKAIKWFLDEVWPKIYQRYPHFEFHLAGRNPVEEVEKIDRPGVFYHGEVADAKAFIAARDLMINPLHSGSGIRIKQIEAMAMGLPVVATSIGAAGIPGKNGIHFIEQNDPDQFAESIITMLQNPDKSRDMGRAASELIRTECNRLRAAEQIVALIRTFNSNQA